jgi:ribosomal protein S18 acetylase RimI-like enzyme
MPTHVPSVMQDCSTPPNLKAAAVIERHHQEWFLAERAVPGAEVHHDRDCTWVVHSGQAWRNAGIMARFSAASAGRRLDVLLTRYRKHGRGMALWVSPLATPRNLPALLTARRLRCQKYFAAMLRKLTETVPRRSAPAGLDVRRVVDLAEYERTPHPAIGPLTTLLRRQAFARLQALVSEPAERTRHFVASLEGTPVGAIEVFLGSESAGIHGLSVLEGFERRGIGSALIDHACHDARGSHATTMVLLATTEGQRLYTRRGFTEVARFGYWYRSFHRS